MRKITCLWVFFAFMLAVRAQPVDSLVNVLNTQRLKPSERLSLYQKICLVYAGNDLEKAVVYAEKGLALAEKEKDRLMASLFNGYLGRIYNTKASYDTALVYWRKALDLAVEAKDIDQEAAVYMGIGNLYGRQGQYAAGLEYYMKALPLYERTDNKKQYMRILGNIGGIHRSMNHNDRAIYYLEQAKAMAEELNDLDGACKAYFDLGAVYLDSGEIDKALEHELKAAEISRTIGRKDLESGSVQALAFIYLKGLKDYDKALEYATESLRIAEEFGDFNSIVGAWNVLSNVYRKQKRYKECEAAALKAWEMDSTNFDIGIDLTANISLSNIFLGNKEKAAEFFWKFTDLIEKYADKTNRETMMEMGVKYETEKKEMQIAALEKEKKLSIGLGVACAAVLSLAFGLLLVRHRLNVQQVKQLKQEKQLVATQSVLDGETAERSRLARDLHDGLGGMLSIVMLNLRDVKGYYIMDGPDVDHFGKALEMLDQSIGELRRVAHHIMPESLVRYGLKVSLEDLCCAIPGAHFRYLGEDARLDSHLEVMLYRCAYELVHNALKHANATSINVQLVADNGLVSLTVHDNGTGFEPETIGNGTGLSNIRTRVSAYNGKMQIYSLPSKGTEVNIEIESV